MMDLYMVAGLGVVFTILYGFTNWCAGIVDDKGRNEQ